VETMEETHANAGDAGRRCSQAVDDNVPVGGRTIAEVLSIFTASSKTCVVYLVSVHV